MILSVRTKKDKNICDMRYNEKIRNSLKQELESKREAFQKLKDKHPLLLDLERKINAFDFVKYHQKVKQTLISNLKDWSIIIPKSEEAVKIDVLLFEYDSTWWKSRQAHAYAIYNWRDYKLSESSIDLDTPYEIVESLEHIPSFTLDFYTCFGVLDSDEILEETYSIEPGGYFDIIGIDALWDYTYYKGCLIIHSVFYELWNEGHLQSLNFRDDAMILFTEHDMDERCLLIF